MSNCRTISGAQLAEIFKALSNPKRLELFHRLLTICGPDGCCSTRDELSLCVDELGRELGLAKSTVSHHLKVLRTAGLVRIERSGQFNDLSFDPPLLRSVAAFFEGCCRSPVELLAPEEIL
jgi:ArsR family transcriptional regulator, arsenate/arsenite/antimonite-responsive transcriptional repressor